MVFHRYMLSLTQYLTSVYLLLLSTHFTVLNRYNQDCVHCLLDPEVPPLGEFTVLLLGPFK